jgi:hypothetical protein
MIAAPGAVAFAKVPAANSVAGGIVRVGLRELVSDFAVLVEVAPGMRPRTLDHTTDKLSPISEHVDDYLLTRKSMPGGAIRVRTSRQD